MNNVGIFWIKTNEKLRITNFFAEIKKVLIFLHITVPAYRRQACLMPIYLLQITLE